MKLKRLKFLKLEVEEIEVPEKGDFIVLLLVES